MSRVISVMLPGFLLGGIAHAQHSVREMSVVTECAVSSQKLLIVPRLQKLLEEVVPVQTFTEQVKEPEVTMGCNNTTTQM